MQPMEVLVAEGPDFSGHLVFSKAGATVAGARLYVRCLLLSEHPGFGQGWERGYRFGKLNSSRQLWEVENERLGLEGMRRGRH